MELFALGDEVSVLEARLAKQTGINRRSPLIVLAWALRQRDCKRALLLEDEAEGMFSAATDDIVKQADVARLLLIRGEVDWLFADLDTAEARADAAILLFTHLGDRIGAGDAKWLLASIWLDRGNGRRHSEWLDLAIKDYRAAGDTLRVNIGVTRSLHFAAFLDAAATAIRMASLFVPEIQQEPAINAGLASALALVPSLGSD